MPATLTALVALSAAACGGNGLEPPPKHFLEGSLGQVMNLGYDETRIALSDSQFSLRFVRLHKLTSLGGDGGTGETGSSEDYPLIVAYRLDSTETWVMDKTTVDLTAVNASRDPKGVASRDVQKDPRTTLPKIVTGSLSVDKALDLGATIHGDFHITFEDGIEAASGRTVFAKAYDAKVTE
jgi:hypothetical protein